MKVSSIESMVVFSLAFFGVSITTIVYMVTPIYMTTINSVTNSTSFVLNTASLAIVVLLIPFFGSISDKYGRIKTVSFGIIILLLMGVTGIPRFDLIDL